MNRQDLASRASRYRSERRTPPEDTGELLVEFPRKDGGVLRWTWQNLDGAQFLSARVWRDGWPQKQGITVRRSELGEVAGVLVEAMDRSEKA